MDERETGEQEEYPSRSLDMVWWWWWSVVVPEGMKNARRAKSARANAFALPVVGSVGSKPCSSLTLAAAASSSTTTIPDSRSSRYTVFEGKKYGLPSLLVGVPGRT